MDFVILDREHGPITLETLHNHVRAAQAGGCSAIVRVPELSAHAIGAALDSGAAGVQVPGVTSATDARRAVDAARFHPHGTRGVCRFVRAAAYGHQDKATYFQTENQKLLILQVEGRRGVEDLDAILAVPGFDVLFIGPYDLSQSVGKPGQIDAPEVQNLIQQIAQRVHDSGRTLGVFTDQSDQVAELEHLGFRYIAYSVDVHIYSYALRAIAPNAPVLQ